MAVRMCSLQVPLDALWTEHAPVEGKVLPGLEADDYVVFDFQLNAALLATETAVGLHQLIGLYVCCQPDAFAENGMRTESSDYFVILNWRL